MDPITPVLKYPNGYFNNYFHKDSYLFQDHHLEFKYKVRFNFSQKRCNPLAEPRGIALFTHLTAVVSLSGRTPGVAKRSEFM